MSVRVRLLWKQSPFVQSCRSNWFWDVRELSAELDAARRKGLHRYWSRNWGNYELARSDLFPNRCEYSLISHVRQTHLSSMNLKPQISIAFPSIISIAQKIAEDSPLAVDRCLTRALPVQYYSLALSAALIWLGCFYGEISFLSTASRQGNDLCVSSR